jgi:hypothetical protein
MCFRHKGFDFRHRRSDIRHTRSDSRASAARLVTLASVYMHDAVHNFTFARLARLRRASLVYVG